MDRHRFDAAPDQDFHVANDPDPDWHQYDADPHADPTPSFKHVGKSEFTHSFASLQCFIFLISVKDVRDPTK